MRPTITRADQLKPKPDESNLGFGIHFTDHMFNMDYAPDKGWYNPRIEPYAFIEMDPASMVLHYGQAVFEGLKAYRTDSGNIQLFRPKDNLNRMNRSCQIISIPEFDEGFVLEALKELINLEKDWVPHTSQTSLYIRPAIIATDPFLGLRVSNAYRFFIILSPVGAYYAEGFNPIKIMVSHDHVRAVRGGIGEAKTPGNYAASLLAGQKAKENGYSQVLWLDGIERRYIEEVGSMNIFFVLGDELITPELSGSILPGITRESVLQLAGMWGLKATERKISIEEVVDAGDSGKLQEVFGSGTAAVISPVGKIKWADKEITIGDGQVGPLTHRLFKKITDIQYGQAEDPYGWIEPV
jgi:branched-chain amino acid aminotransferase